ncbi:putative vacuolar protein sorting-associated protein TDA6 isoform X1 [Sitophilus oryzae]|uniref:Vacuolar protein sorting-associated protein TDA6 isoform X1 n=1 Tax=Sitophilus oryzae TaxID=7048 RepID=A0A6J2XLB2_SITOR|nr:putative vacuolar protein sorting-associated protein TDA6 isoform X1 [Sitophilus oryzae]
MFAIRVVYIFLLSFTKLYCAAKEKGNVTVENLVKQWSPLIWLAPDEKYMPLDVEQFLENVDIADENAKIISQSRQLSRFHSKRYNSKKSYLVPSVPLDDLKTNSSSFLYGKSPKLSPTVPVYAVITYCNHFSKGNVAKSGFNKTKSPLPYFHVSYWMFYPYNEGKDVCFIGKWPTPLIFSKCFGRYKKMGNHVGDWEHMTLLFSGKEYPEKLYLSLHDLGAYYTYEKATNTFKFESRLKKEKLAHLSTTKEFPEYVRLQGGHPVLFAAEGSHGLWAAPGEHEFVRIPSIRDKNGYGTPWKTWASIKFHHSGRSAPLPWMRFKGRWGSPKSNCVLSRKFGLCELTDGPRGLLRDDQDFYC